MKALDVLKSLAETAEKTQDLMVEKSQNSTSSLHP